MSNKEKYIDATEEFINAVGMTYTDSDYEEPDWLEVYKLLEELDNVFGCDDDD